EPVDALLPGPRCLVATDRHVPDAPLREGLLRGVHHVDVLGEEDDLADVVRELRGVVRRERRLRLTDPAHHAEDVLAAAALIRVLPLAGRHLPGERAVDAGRDDAVAAGGDGRLVALDEAPSEGALGGPNRATH